MQWQQETRPGVFGSLVALFVGGRGTLLTLLLAPLLGALALWLPPVSLAERLFDTGYTPVPREGATFTDPDGARLILPTEAMPTTEGVKVQFLSASRQSFIEGTAGGVLTGAPEALPSNLVPKSPVYVAAVRGASPTYSDWMLPIPNDSEPYSLLDLYGWDGSAWGWLPHTLLGEEIGARVAGVPLAVAVMQAQRLPNIPPQVTALTDENADFLTQAGGTVGALSPRLYLVQGDGSIGQLFTPSPAFGASGALLLPVLSNVEPSGVTRNDLVDNLLIDPNAWRIHAERIESLVVATGYDGIVVDYRRVDPILRDAFSQFIGLLGERLAAQGKQLVVRVDPPVRVAADRFDTGAYDLNVIGQAATFVRVPTPRAPGSYVAPDDPDALLAFLTGAVNRYKLELELPAAPYALADGQVVPVPYADVAAQLGAAEPDPTTGQPPALPLDELVRAGQLVPDAALGTYRFTVDGRELFLENAATLAARLAQVEAYNLAGIALDYPGLADPSIWEAVRAYQAR